MKFSELSDKVLERLKQRQYDLILQKHERIYSKVLLVCQKQALLV